jgi:hypothetical protein
MSAAYHPAAQKLHKLFDGTLPLLADRLASVVTQILRSVPS